MPPREIAGRIADRWALRRLERLAQRPEELAGRVRDMQLAVLSRCQGLILGSSARELNALREQNARDYVELAERCERVASAIATGRYELLGRQVALTSSLDWHTDPVTGFTWEKEFFGNVSYHQVPPAVDFKHIWELGRHQYLVELVRSWAMSRDDWSLLLTRQILGDWISKNPFCVGIHWTSGLEVAMRAISWIWTLAHGHDHWQQDAWTPEWLGQLSLHGHYIENHLSVYSSPYNHVIGEGAALYLLGIVFEGSPDAARWQARGRSILHEFGPRQFYDDGFCVEQAVGYHYYTLGFLTLAMLAGRTAGDVELQLTSLLTKSFRAGLTLRRPQGTWPSIGDVDSASSIPVARADFWDFSSLHRLAAAALDDSSLDCCNQRFSDESYWLLGTRGAYWQGTGAPEEAKAKVTVLQQAGYFIARSSDDWLLFDAGPVAAGLHRDGTPSVAHGHADTLQILVDLNRQAVLRDSGIPNYSGNAKRMDHFRSPAAHNTVVFADTPLVRQAGRLAWSHDLTTTKLQWSDGLEYWRACGEVQWADCSIRRHLLMFPGEAVWIADVLISRRPQVAHWSWQFASQSWEIANCSQRTVALANDSLQIASVAGQDGFTAQLLGPDRDGCRGWDSPAYGRVAPSQSLSCQLNVIGASIVLTVLGTPKRCVTFSVDPGTPVLTSSVKAGPGLSAPLFKEGPTIVSFGGGVWRVDA